jgi:hypothetical protein
VISGRMGVRIRTRSAQVKAVSTPLSQFHGTF